MFVRPAVHTRYLLQHTCAHVVTAVGTTTVTTTTSVVRNNRIRTVFATESIYTEIVSHYLDNQFGQEKCKNSNFINHN